MRSTDDDHHYVIAQERSLLQENPAPGHGTGMKGVLTCEAYRWITKEAVFCIDSFPDISCM